MTEEIALFVPDGERFVPTGLGASPWSERTQGGIALAGLSAHVVETIVTTTPMHVARLTIDIMGAAPMEPLTSSVRVVRDGRRIQLIEAELQSGGRTWVRANALRVRTAETPERAIPRTRELPEVERAEPGMRSNWVETIPVEGEFLVPGPGARWVRFMCPVVAGTTLSPLERMAMLSDWGSGISSLLDPRIWSLANVDISLHLTRPPRGDWLLIDAVSESAGNAIAIANNRLGDCEGMIGTAHQTIFLDRR